MKQSSILVLVMMLALPVSAQKKSYVADYDFLRKTVAARGAAVASKRLDWSGISKSWKPRFAAATTDVEHLRNVMGFLAELGDSHTGVTRSSVSWNELPSKWDGLYGGGLWLGWDRGLVIVRGLMKGHALASRLEPGSVIVEIDGMPAWFAMAREKQRIGRSVGISSDHSLFASMGNRFLPFGEKRRIEIAFITPDGKSERATVDRWGPGGKSFSMLRATLPKGVEPQSQAFSKMLSRPWCKKVGYLRITGGMNADTLEVFHRAFDALEGMEALMLDCRGMGGGGDGSAWEMAGRLFPKGAANGRNRRIEASGSWQFDGPVVMLQDELEVSSAETFTWAVSETERVVSVGRSTGGWGIIPNRFKCPSGLVDFRLGVNDRPTPIRGIRTEGIGWPADVSVPYGPGFCGQDDVVGELGWYALQSMVLGLKPDQARSAFAELMRGDVKAMRKICKAIAKRKSWRPQSVEKLSATDLKAMLAVEKEILTNQDLVPDLVGLAARMDDYVQRAKRSGQSRALKSLEKARKAARRELAAQAAVLDLLKEEKVSKKALSKFRKKHGKTRVGRFAAGFF